MAPGSEISDVVLQELFLQMFSPGDLRLFLEIHYPIEARALPERGSAEELAWSAVTALRRHGRIDATLIARLIEQRPARRSMIESCSSSLRLSPSEAISESRMVLAPRSGPFRGRYFAVTALVLTVSVLLAGWLWKRWLHQLSTIDVIYACTIRCEGCPGLIRGWIILESGQSFVARIHDGNELRFECVRSGTKVAVLLELRDERAEIHYYMIKDHELGQWEDSIPFSEFYETSPPPFVAGSRVLAGAGAPPVVPAPTILDPVPATPDHAEHDPSTAQSSQSPAPTSERRRTPRAPTPNEAADEPAKLSELSGGPSPHPIAADTRSVLSEPKVEPSVPSPDDPASNPAQTDTPVRSLMVQVHTGNQVGSATADAVTLQIGSQLWGLGSPGVMRMGYWARFELDASELLRSDLAGKLRIKKQAGREPDPWLLDAVIIKVNGKVVYQNMWIDKWLDESNPEWSDTIADEWRGPVSPPAARQ